MSEWNLVNFSEIDKYAIKSYCAVHGVDESKNLGDITKVKDDDLPEFTMLAGGSPCFVSGTLVLTEDGYKPIEDIVCGEKVLTHNNQYMEVTKTMNNKTNELVRIKSSASNIFECTLNHPLYIRTFHRERERYDRIFSNPKWEEAQNIKVNYYIGTAINSEACYPNWNGYEYHVNQFDSSNMIHRNELSSLFDREEFWYIIGRYIGDGWLSKNDGKSIIICCPKKEESLLQITEKLDKINFNYCVVKQRTTYRVQIVKKELFLFLSQFGFGASNKHLTKDIINLPIQELQSFLNGYIESDGCCINGKYKISSVSKQLIFDTGACVSKVYKMPFSVYYTKRPKTCQIEGRTVNQKDSYTIVWKTDKKKQDHAFYEAGYIWSPITKIEKKKTEETEVFNLEVKEDHSYVVQSVIVHNCQDFSQAGKQQGSTWKCKSCGYEYNPITAHYSERNTCPKCGSSDLDKTRSSLLIEYLRAVRIGKPEWGIYENVKALTSKKFEVTFNLFLKELEEYGYNVYYQVLNAKDYGVPQNRERVYVIYIRKDLDNGKFKFPEPFDNGLRLKDVLEDEVDEKYYVKTEGAKKLIEKLIMDGKLPENGGGMTASVKKNCTEFEKTIEYAKTLLSRDYKGFGNFQATNCVIEKF